MRYIMITLICIALLVQIDVNIKQQREIEQYKQEILRNKQELIINKLKFDHYQKLKVPSLYKIVNELQNDPIPDTLSYEELAHLTQDIN